MKNLIVKIITFVMNFFGVSIEDLVAFKQKQIAIKNSSKDQKGVTYDNKLPLEVLYENNYRSFFVEKDKTPVAIICGGLGFAFDDAPKKMSWHDANKFCKKYSVGGKEWSLPNKDAGHLVTLYKNKKDINEVLMVFGKEPLKEHWYWASKYASNWAWELDLSDGSVIYSNKYYDSFYVRPITVL